MPQTKIPRVTVTDKDVQDPATLRRLVDGLYEKIYGLLGQIQTMESDLRSNRGQVGGLAPSQLRVLKSVVIGSTESSPAIRALIPTVSSLPPVINSTDGEIVYLSTDSSLYRFDSSTRSWVAVTALSGYVTIDTAEDITGSKTFKAQQIFDFNGLAVLIKPASAPSANQIVFQIQSSAATNRFSVDEDGDVIIAGTLLVNGASVEFDGDLQVDGGLLVRRDDYGIKIQPSVLPSANQVLFEVLSSAGASRMTIDEDGDIDCAAIISDSIDSTAIYGNSLEIQDNSNNPRISIIGGSSINTSYIDINTARIYAIAGTPESTISANPGSICMDTTNGKLYVKESGFGDTGWVLK